jgi:hypothetical protein
MEMTELHDRLRAALTDFLWDQWVALGLAGHASGTPVPFVIDPEALLLATLRFGMNEARFRGEVLDWLQRNGSLLSVQRMKNLDVATHMAPPEHIRGLSAFMVRAGHPTRRLTERAAGLARSGDKDSLRATEREIDGIVYRLFSLTPAEIALIEEVLS